MEEKAGFLKSLFDFSFSHFITSKIIKFLYGISIAFGGLGALYFLIDGIRSAFRHGRSTEEGFEKVYQSSVLFPNWKLSLEPNETWELKIINKITDL